MSFLMECAERAASSSMEHLDHVESDSVAHS